MLRKAGRNLSEAEYRSQGDRRDLRIGHCLWLLSQLIWHVLSNYRDLGRRLECAGIIGR
jgi:hypothetical protein